MLLIRTKSSTASSTASTLRGRVQHQRWVVVPCSTDVRAAKEAAAQAGDSKAIVFSFDFIMGFLVGSFACCIVWVAYTTGVAVGLLLSEVEEKKQVLQQR